MASTTILPSSSSAGGSASGVRHGTARNTTSPNRAASSTVAAWALGPMASTSAVNESGPRWLLTATRCPAPARSRATVPPMFPDPMTPMSMQPSLVHPPTIGDMAPSSDLGEPIVVRSPYDGSEVGQVPRCSAADVDKAVAAALAAHEAGPLPPWRRAEILDAAARLLAERVEDFARTIAAESAKPLKTARTEARGRSAPSPSRRSKPAGSPATWCRSTPPRSARAGWRSPCGSRRRGRRHLAVQLPAQPGGPQAGPGHRRRLPGGAQAGQPDAADGGGPGPAAGRRLRPAGRPPPRGHRQRRRGRRRPGPPSRTWPTSPSPARARSAGGSRTGPGARRSPSSWATTRR